MNLKFIAGPMATVSHQGFRMTVEAFGGCDEYFTEMINASSFINGGPWEKFYVLNDCAPEKIVWQLTGNDGTSIAKAASLLCKKEGIGIDINMGCSAPQIYKTGAGISWMLKPLSETEDTVKKTRDALLEHEAQTGEKKRLSVKCRLGDDSFSDEGFFSFIEMLYKNGVKLITLHPRTKKEKERFAPRFSYAERIKKLFPQMQVYINGCIKNKETALNALKQCPSADGIMISREAAKRPWIFAELKEQLKAEENGTEYIKSFSVDREKVLLDYIDYVIKYQPKEFVKTRLQRFFSLYCPQFSFGHWFTMRLINSKSIEECEEKIKEYFLHNPSDRIVMY